MLMKKTILITILALLGITQAVAQEYEYVPFVREGVKWVYFYTNYDDTYPASPYLPIGTIYLNLEFKGDTIINGKTYKAMHKYHGNAINVNSDTIPIYMRENDKVVYAIVPNGIFYKDCPIGNYAWTEEEYEPCYNGQEFILYDFNNPVTYWDDLVNQHNWYQYTDTIVVGQHLAKRVVGNMPVIFHQIEGIGIDGYSSYILSFFMPMLVGIGGPFFHLSHVIEDGQIIYKGFNFDPGNATGIDEVVAEPRPRQYDDNYYNLMGQPVGKDIPTTPGIYIHHGKKIAINY